MVIINNIRSKARPIIIKVMTCVVILEEWKSPHILESLLSTREEHEVFPETGGIDNHGCL